MKKFKIEYGIVREYDEVTLWFEPIDDDLDALVLRNRSGEILSVFTEQRKKEERQNKTYNVLYRYLPTGEHDSGSDQKS